MTSPIKVDLSNVRKPLDNIAGTAIIQRGKQIATEYERKMLGFATLKHTLVIYVTMETKTEIKESVYNSFITWEFSARQPKGKECTRYDLTKLVTMGEREFEHLPHTENYEMAKMYRDTMRETPKVKKLLKNADIHLQVRPFTVDK